MGAPHSDELVGDVRVVQLEGEDVGDTQCWPHRNAKRTWQRQETEK